MFSIHSLLSLSRAVDDDIAVRFAVNCLARPIEIVFCNLLHVQHPTETERTLVYRRSFIADRRRDPCVQIKRHERMEKPRSESRK